MQEVECKGRQSATHLNTLGCLRPRADSIERCLAAVTAGPEISGRSCVEGSVVSVRSVVCAHFVSDYFWQILADFWQILADLGGFLALGRGPGFAIFGSEIGAKIMKKHEK